MTEKFSLDDLFMKVVPGGVLIGILYFLYFNSSSFQLQKGLDFFYTFLFFTFAYLTGEVIQTIARQLEFIINIFFKFYRPSHIFLYKNNPILKNERTREKIIEKLSLSQSENAIFEKEYKEVRWFNHRENTDISQYHFNKLYHNFSGEVELKIFNRGYLLVRGIITLLIITIILFGIEGKSTLMYCSIILFFLFLWRARGMARTLISKTVYLNLK
jgi:hypothetical protein